MTSHLFLVGEEELVRVHAIGDCATEHGEPVEDDRRLALVLEQQLLQNIHHDRDQEKGGKPRGDEDGDGRILGELAQ